VGRSLGKPRGVHKGCRGKGGYLLAYLRKAFRPWGRTLQEGSVGGGEKVLQEEGDTSSLHYFVEMAISFSSIEERYPFWNWKKEEETATLIFYLRRGRGEQV